MLTVGSLNLGNGPAAALLLDLDRLVALGVDVLCTQEASDRGPLLDAWARSSGWAVFYGDGTPGAAACPILWRRGLRVDRLTTREAVEGRVVGDPGAGPARVKRKVVNGARVRRRGRRRVRVLNTHLIASATRVGLPNAAARRRHYADHVAALVRAVQHRGPRAVVLLGDFNAPPGFRLLAPLHRLGLRQVVTDATHHRRTVDHAWVRPGRLARRAVVRTVSTSSDHAAVLVTLP